MPLYCLTTVSPDLRTLDPDPGKVQAAAAARQARWPSWAWAAGGACARGWWWAPTDRAPMCGSWLARPVCPSRLGAGASRAFVSLRVLFVF